MRLETGVRWRSSVLGRIFVSGIYISRQKEERGRWFERTALEDADHVLDLVGIGILPAQRLRAEDFTLAHGIVPIEIFILFDVALLPRRALLNGTNTETSRQTVTPSILDGHGIL